jgi:hypothetical protein
MLVSKRKKIYDWFVVMSLSFALICLLPENILSQRIEWAPGVKENFQNSNVRFLGSVGDTIYAAKMGSDLTLPEILVFRADSLLLANRYLLPSVHEGQETIRTDALVLAGERLVLAGSMPAKEKGFRQVISISYSLRGELLDGPVSLGVLPEGNSRETEYLQSVVSPEGKAVLFVQETKAREVKNPATYWCAVISAGGLLWSKSIELPYPREIASIDQWMVGEDGNLAMLSGAGAGKELSVPSKEAFSHQRHIVFIYRHQDNKIKEFEVNLRDKWISNLAIAPSHEGHIYVGGYYSAQPYFSVAGVFMLVIDAVTGTIREKGMSPIDKQIIRKFRQDDSDLGREISALYLDHFHVSADGTASLVGEQFYVREYWLTEPSTGRQTVSYEYHHNGVLLSKLSSRGVLEWSVQVPKRQRSSNDIGAQASYTYHYKDGTSWILFNDHPLNTAGDSNSASDEPETYTGTKQGVFVAVSIDSRGTMNKVSLDTKEKKASIRPLRSWVSSESLILYPELDRKMLTLTAVRF